MKLIPLGGRLGKGKFTQVDDEDYEHLNQFYWQLNDRGYVQGRYRRFKREQWRNVKMHRIIIGVPRGVSVDHIDGNKTDNRRRNLRPCNQTQNAGNQKLSSANTSGFKGVSFKKDLGQWRAKIHYIDTDYHLGYFPTPVTAAMAYDIAARDIFGDFARLNFPNGIHG